MTELPQEVVLAIQRVLEIQETPERDDLDVLSNFTPVVTLNGYFPDEASLGQLEIVRTKLANSERQLQEEIDALHEELRKNQEPANMGVIQEMISDLLHQMSLIREKATESEAVVRNITKDIQALDLVKKNLTLSMTVLKRLQMLVNSLHHLEGYIKERKYDDVAQSLSAIKQIGTSFKPYMGVPRIALLWSRILELQGALRTILDEDFAKFYAADSNVAPATNITAACAAVTVLGPEVQHHFTSMYVTTLLSPYKRIFAATDEAGGLDNISRRFAWFKRILTSHETGKGRVFPAEWRVDWAMFRRFVDVTRDDMSQLLDKAGSSLTVQVLLDTLQQSIEFEQSMSKKWLTDLSEILKGDTSSVGQNKAVKRISSAWESHMGVFIDAQDKAISDLLAPHRGAKARNKATRQSLDAAARTSTDGDEDSGQSVAIVLPSSTELFYFYGQTLDQCAKLSRGSPLSDLATLHKKWLRIYAEDVLVASLKKNHGPASYIRRSTDVKFDSAELQQACLLVNTADYCQTTAVELEERIQEKIVEEFKDKISFQVERDLFVNVISTAIASVLRELDNATESAFGVMSRTSWPTLNNVIGPSAYVAVLTSALESVIETTKPLIEKKTYMRNLLDKVSNFVLTKFTNVLVRSRPLKEIGAEQLLIDLAAVKACLTKLPGEALTTTSYTRGLTKTTTRIEALLKVIVTPIDPPEGFILNYTLVIGDASFSNFQKILDLKGTPRADQNTLLDTFLTITSLKTDLESTSFLSTLDMDPPLTTSANIASPGSSRTALPLSSGGVVVATAADGIFSGLSSPPRSAPTTGDNTGAGGEAGRAVESGARTREVFSDIRRLMSFGLRRDSTTGV